MTAIENVMNGTAILAVVIFLISYALIISEKINRAIIALVGALLMILFGVINLHGASTEHIHWSAIFLLIGMMILVGITERSGFFKYIAVITAQKANGDPVKILVRLSILTAIGSAFIDNVTTVLIITPVIIAIARTLDISPIPFLISEILICNIGGASTLVGDPPNIMIGAAANISFNDFFLHMTPIIIILLILTILFLRFYYRSQLSVKEENKRKLAEIDAKSYLVNIPLMKKSLFVFGLTILGFLTHQFFDIEPATVAMSGATLLLVLEVKDDDTLENILHSVEWITIFFFFGLFVIVGGLVEVGVINLLASKMIELTGGSLEITSMAILWLAGVASAFVDNIPLVATLIPMIQDMSVQLNLESTAVSTLWWSLALGACLGGNGTIVASSANLIIVANAKKEGYPISFMTFFKIAAPVTIGTLIIASIYIYVAFLKLGFA